MQWWRVMSVPFLQNARYRDCLFLVLVAAMVGWFWRPLISLFSLSFQSGRPELYSHIVLIPCLSLYFLYMERTAIFAAVEWGPSLGALSIAAGAVLNWSVGASTLDKPDNLSLAIFAMLMMYWGVFLLCYGMRAFQKASFALLLLLFMVPIPSFLLDAVIGFLLRGSAETTDFLFGFLGVPVLRQDFVFVLPNLAIHIAEECSGIRSTLALFITSLVAGHLFLRSPWTKIGLVMAIVPLAIFKNAVRIVGLSLLANYVDVRYITDSALHRNGGIPLFLVSLVILFGIVRLLRRCEVSPRTLAT